MKRKLCKNRIVKILFFLSTLLTVISSVTLSAFANELTHYNEYLKLHDEITGYKGGDISIEASAFTNKTDNAQVNITEIDGKANVLLWNEGDGRLDYQVEITESAFYNIIVEYYVPEQGASIVERGIMIDGSLPFAESGNSLFDKMVRDAIYPFSHDDYGNDVLPRQEEILGWRETAMSDRNKRYNGAFLFYMEKGSHTLSLVGVKGTLAISEITLRAPEFVGDYEWYIGGKETQNDSQKSLLFTFEAENTELKSGKKIHPVTLSEPGVTPETIGTRSLNTLGGDSFSDAGDWVQWTFDVPEDGDYTITFKYKQSSNLNLTSFRTVFIDGEMPFKQLEEVAFPFTARWSNMPLGGETPFKFYLTKGSHTLRLAVTCSPYKDVYDNLSDAVRRLRDIDLRVKEIIGIDTDVYRIWKLESYIPGLSEELRNLANIIDEQNVALVEITKSKKNAFSELGSAVDNLHKYADKPDDIAKSEDSLTKIFTDLTNWVINLEKSPLLLDKYYVSSGEYAAPTAGTGLFSQAIFAVRNFFSSFFAEPSLVSNDSGQVIQVWVKRNRDYVNLMQQMANEYYTPMSGVRVNVNYIPDNNLMVLANASGKQPDVATGIDMSIPYEYAMRDALVDMGSMEGYKELAEQVVPGSLVPYRYESGNYGLPEEVMYNILYYREDILNKMGVQPPDTWDDVLKLIPTLLQNNYNFFYPYGDYQTFFTQRGVPVYTSDGLALSCDSEEGFKAFQFWTDLYVKYGMPAKMDSFYQHFRIGDVPVGATGINEYIRFDMTAPDISGQWKVALMPGTVDEDGNVVRWQGGDQTGLMMFKTTEQRQAQAWDYVQWWLSTDVQSMFAEDLENYYGMEFRWYSANPEVLKRQSWNQNAKEVMLEQLQWYNPVPYVPGGSYMTGREIWNAWTRTVIDKLNYREQFELSLADILREMQRKQREFGFIDDDGNKLKSLDFISVPVPNIK